MQSYGYDENLGFVFGFACGRQSKQPSLVSSSRKNSKVPRGVSNRVKAEDFLKNHLKVLAFIVRKREYVPNCVVVVCVKKLSHYKCENFLVLLYLIYPN